MSTYDCEPNPSDYGPEPEHIANPSKVTYKVGDSVRMTTTTYGERVFDRKGKPVYAAPTKSVYAGVVTYVGPECPFPSPTVVRCNGGNVELKLNSGFQFYPKDNGAGQLVEKVLK